MASKQAAKGLALVGAVGLLLAATFILWRAGLPDSPDFVVGENGIEAVQVGAFAPLFTAQTLDGQTIALEDARGYPVILNFWATWCEPCVVEMPILEAVHQGGVDVVGINVGQEDATLVRAWVKSAQLHFPMVMDDANRTLESRYRIQAFPTTIFIDKQGIIRHIEHGALDESSLRQGLDSIGINS